MYITPPGHISKGGVHREGPLLTFLVPHPLLDSELLSGRAESDSSLCPQLSKELKAVDCVIPSESIKKDRGSSLCSKETYSVVGGQKVKYKKTSPRTNYIEDEFQNKEVRTVGWC